MGEGIGRRSGTRRRAFIPVRVLMVDDDEAFSRAIAKRFGNTSRFDRAPSLEAARFEMARASYDALVLDLHLTDGNGLEWLAAERADGFEMRAVLLSSADERKLPERAASARAGFIHKNEGVGRLCAALCAFLERVATDTPFRDLLVHFAEQHALTEAQVDTVEAARWVGRHLLHLYLGKPETVVAAQLTSLCQKTGQHDVEAVLGLVLDRTRLGPDATRTSD